MVCIHTENQNQGDFCPFALLKISVLHESPLGHLRYGLTDVPPQPNSPFDTVFRLDRTSYPVLGAKKRPKPLLRYGVRKIALRVVVFHSCGLPPILHPLSHFSESN